MKTTLKSRYNDFLPSGLEKANQLQRDIVAALAYAPSTGLSATQLARLLGQPDKIVINGAFGKFAKSLWPSIGEHPDGYGEGDFEWWTLLATGEAHEDEFRWILRPEVLEVVRASVETNGTDPTLAVRLREGRLRSADVDIYERNPVARRRCLEAHGYACAVCGVVLAHVYGAIAEKVIHVHHLRTLSDIGTDHEVDPVQDLRPVCPNCHAIIHLRSEPLSIDEIRARIADTRHDA